MVPPAKSRKAPGTSPRGDRRGRNLPAEDRQTEIRLARTARAWFACSLAVAIALTYLVVRLFETPDPHPASGGDVSLSVNGTNATESRPPVFVATFSPGGAKTYYDVVLPRELGGQTFDLSMDSSAVLYDVQAEGPGRTQLQVTTKLSPASASDDIPSERISGRVPQVTKGDAADGAIPIACLPTGADLSDYIGLQFSGRTNTVSDSGGLEHWPFQVYALPAIEVFYGGSSGHTPYYSSQICTTTTLPSGYVVANANPAPSKVDDSTVVWLQNPFEADAVTIRHSYTEPLANLSIILAGVAFAAAAGFIPMLVETTTRRSHKARPARPHARRWPRHRVGR
jgi:hypothetical protein